jgi:hypothetical protein
MMVKLPAQQKQESLDHSFEKTWPHYLVTGTTVRMVRGNSVYRRDQIIFKFTNGRFRINIVQMLHLELDMGMELKYFWSSNFKNQRNEKEDIYTSRVLMCIYSALPQRVYADYNCSHCDKSLSEYASHCTNRCPN